MSPPAATRAEAEVPSGGAGWPARALRLLGWRVNIVPPPAKCLIIVYPHTSNWDFPLGYLAKLAARLPVHWVGKDSLFRPPVAGLLRRMGGIPVNRRAPGGLAEALARELERRPRMLLAMTPEGTRSYTDRWKTGFYRVALAARVPVGLAYIDYRAREIGLATYLTLSGDEERDLERIRAVYDGKVGRRPALAGAIRFHAPPDRRSPP